MMPEFWGPPFLVSSLRALKLTDYDLTLGLWEHVARHAKHFHSYGMSASMGFGVGYPQIWATTKTIIWGI